jgi:group I intron endonuclease
MKHGVVYRITNLENGKCYIGRTRRALHKRWYDHCLPSSGCLHLNRAIKKYGKESFSITEIASSWDHESLKELEMILIKQEKTLVPNGYNLVNTSNGAGEVSEETRERLGRGRKGKPSPMKGKKFSEESRKNMGGQNKGKKVSDETKKKRSQVLKGLKWYTNGIIDCRFRDGENIPDGFKPGRTKGLDNLSMLAESWNDPIYREHMSDVHKGRRWFTDGVNDLSLGEEDIIPDGFKLGRTNGLLMLDRWKVA